MASDSYADRLKEKINDMTECAICTDTLKEARLLPCFHSFCLKCLKDYGKEKTAGNDINCPICRKSFKIPGKGFEELPINHFINKLIDIIKLPDVGGEKESQNIFCDWCLTTKSQVAASGYCVDCSENLCEPCLQRHKSVKTCRFHKTLPLDQKPGINELLKMTVNNCEDHPHQQIDFYCDDCKTTACVVCYVAEHKDHKCSDIKKSSAEMTERIDNGCEKVSSLVSETEEIVKRIETTEEDMDKNIEEVRESVKVRYEELKALLDSHYKQLDDKLNDLKSVQKKELQTVKEESEQEVLMVKTLEKYWTEVKERGSACDVVQAASIIEERLEELIKHHDMQHQERSKKSSLEKFEFKLASSVSMNSLSADHGDSMLGTIVKVESINNEIHRSDWKMLRTSNRTGNLLTGTDGRPITCIAIHNDELFLVKFGYSGVDVYDLSNSFIRKRQINVPNMTSAVSLVYSETDSCLYASNQYSGYIHKIDYSSSTYVHDSTGFLKRKNEKLAVSDEASMHGWSVKSAGQPSGLSISRQKHLLVSIYNAGLVLEYNSDEELIRSVKLCGITGVNSALELESGQFVICQRTPQSQICLAESDGTILKSYRPDQMFFNPTCILCIAMDEFGNMMFVDYLSSRLTVLNSQLQLIGDVTCNQKVIKKARCLHWDGKNNRLLVGSSDKLWYIACNI